MNRKTSRNILPINVSFSKEVRHLPKAPDKKDAEGETRD